MSSQTDYLNYLSSLSNSINYYGLWIIFPTCLVGNIISLYIFTKPKLNKKTNTGFLYMWLCALNLITVIYYCLIYRGSILFKYAINLPCGVESFIRRTFLNSITWIQVVICLDRFIAVVYPIRRKLMRKKIVLYGILLTCLAIILITNMTNLMTYPVTNAKNVTSCFMTSDVTVATYLIANLMRFFIPFAIMVTFNLLVIYFLKRGKVRVGNVIPDNIDSSQRPQRRSLRRLTRSELKFTGSTLIIDSIFLFFYLPLGANYVVQTYGLFNNSLKSNTVGYAVFQVFSNLSQVLALAHTSAIVIVFVVFNDNFRAELIVFLRLHRVFPNLKPENPVNVARPEQNK